MRKQLLPLVLTIFALFTLLSMPALADEKAAIAIMTFKEGQLSKW